MKIFETTYEDKNNMLRNNCFYIFSDAERDNIDKLYPAIATEYQKLKPIKSKKLNKFDDDALNFLGRCRNFGHGKGKDAGEMLDITTKQKTFIIKMLIKVIGEEQTEELLHLLGFYDDLEKITTQESFENMERKRRMKREYEESLKQPAPSKPKAKPTPQPEPELPQDVNTDIKEQFDIIQDALKKIRDDYNEQVDAMLELLDNLKTR